MTRRFLYKASPYALFMYSSLSLAALPVTVQYSSGTTSFTANQTGSASYVVRVGAIEPTNTPLTFNVNSNSSNGLTATQTTTGTACAGVSNVCSTNTFSLSANESCCLEFSLTSSNAGSYSLKPSVKSTAYAYQATSATVVSVSGAVGNTPLTATPPTLALSVKCTTSGGGCVYSNSALTGTARVITITNTSTTETTTPLSVTKSGFPTGTTITNDACNGASLSPLGTCAITITPGQVATSNCTRGTRPSPGSVTVRASSAPSDAISNVLVLGYGCIYQGGFIYSINDSTSTAGSIGGKVAALKDEFLASKNPQPGTPNWGGDGCDIGAKLWSNDTQGANDGSANSSAIVDALTTNYSSGPCPPLPAVDLKDYAAGRCSQYTTLSDAGLKWYLPSICELSGASTSNNCTAGTTSMLNQLWLLDPAVGGFVNEGVYWSSTELADSYYAKVFAWYQQFSSGGYQSGVNKYGALGVRCSRALSL